MLRIVNIKKCDIMMSREVNFMFRYVKLKNYKSLINFTADLTTRRDTPSKLVVIYGENGIGKSNFARCFLTLCHILQTKYIQEDLENILSSKNIPDVELIKTLVKLRELESIIKQCKTNGSTDNMVLEYGFRLKGYNGIYRLETDNTKIVSEHLEFVWNRNKTTFFSIKNGSVELNNNIFKKIEYKKELQEIISKYWGKHALLSLILYEVRDKKDGYVSARLSKNLMDVVDYFTHLFIRVKEGRGAESGMRDYSHAILANLDEGQIPLTDSNELEKVECLLNTFFTSLYSDVKQVFYRRKHSKDKIQYELYFKKHIFDKLIDVSFRQESTGTQNLLDILPFFIATIDRKTVIIDEIDTGIHDILINNIMENLYKSIKGQLIITTHNTMLLESDFAKKCVYILKADHKANKTLCPLSAFEERLHPNLNMRKRYISGLYGGVPIAMDIDFDELAQTLE